jgi:hypothetical protein
METDTLTLLINTGKALYGERWQTDLARELKLSDSRRIRQWLSKERPIPAGILKDLRILLCARQHLIQIAITQIDNG